ncbi:hypothetical protein [Vreelandella zhanjiangensis]|uniref:hypothetical protein n=1 Tax=Vreelandella zhanjiangensis TaxID=1121960 RepID=UPI00037C5D39|nr:hypothetical protein [Halomonas zhanjiangensis]
MIIRILNESFSALLNIKHSTFIALAAAFLLALIAELALLGVGVLQPRPLMLYLTLEWLAEGVAIVSYTILVTIICHTVLREQAIRFGWGFFWGRRETRFFLHILGLYALLIPVSLLAFVPVGGPWLMMLAAGYFYSRFALVLPGIALDQKITFKLAWQLSRQHQISAFVLLALLPSIGWSIVELLLGELYLFPLRVVVNFFISIFSAIAMAILYREIVFSAAALSDDSQSQSAHGEC